MQRSPSIGGSHARVVRTSLIWFVIPYDAAISNGRRDPFGSARRFAFREHKYERERCAKRARVEHIFQADMVPLRQA
jgi:hypothetical protein